MDFVPTKRDALSNPYARPEPDSNVWTDGGYADLHNGKRKATVYYWLDPKTGAALEHTGVNDESTIPFFPDEETALEYLEKRAERGDKADYEGLSLYKARTRKVGDAVEVLTDQSGIVDFVPDGGRPEDTLQIPNPHPPTLWFWYDSTIDRIDQEEVEPYDVRGVFPSEDNAAQFLQWYADEYGEGDLSHLELYTADVELVGRGDEYLSNDGEPKLPEQASWNEFRSTPEDRG